MHYSQHNIPILTEMIAKQLEPLQNSYDDDVTLQLLESPTKTTQG